MFKFPFSNKGLSKYLTALLYFLENFQWLLSGSENNYKLHYFSTSTGLFAIFAEDNTGTQMHYIHKDHLGSFQSITNEDGELLEKLSFDPWGRRRNPDDWSFVNVPESFTFDRGYTGHEHLDVFNLINMNGRVYDPFVARFLSPDPFVQATNHTQSYNRYSYAMNNPLIYIDPSGYTVTPTEAINTLLNSEFGGLWTPGGGLYFYNSGSEAFEAGINYQGQHGSWAYTEYGSEQATREVYNIISNSSQYNPNLFLGILFGEHYVNYNYSTAKFYYVGTSEEIDIKSLLNGEGEGSTGGGGFLADHFYIGAEGEISYGVQLSGIVYKGAGLNINPVSQVVTEGGISNGGSYVNSYPIVPASQMDKGKALDFGVAWIVGGNYNWNIENGKHVSSTASLGVYGFGGNITWDNSGVTNLFIGFELSGKAAAVWGAGGSGKIGFIWNW